MHKFLKCTCENENLCVQVDFSAKFQNNLNFIFDNYSTLN
jgi:hypothetical protein